MKKDRSKITPEKYWHRKADHYKPKKKSKRQKMRRFIPFYLSDTQLYDLYGDESLLESFAFGGYNRSHLSIHKRNDITLPQTDGTIQTKTSFNDPIIGKHGKLIGGKGNI